MKHAGITEKRGKDGFTLIELLVVIAIIAILAAILFPIFTEAKKAGQKTACLNNLKQVGMSCMMYFDGYGGKCFPKDPMGAPAIVRGYDYRSWVHAFYKSWCLKRAGYLKNDSAFKCPSDTGWIGMGNGMAGIPFCKLPEHDYNSYVFNGCNALAGYSTVPGMAGRSMSDLSQAYPASRVILVGDGCMHVSISWHDGDKNVYSKTDTWANLCFFDGHAKQMRIWQGTPGYTWLDNPPEKYVYSFGPKG